MGGLAARASPGAPPVAALASAALGAMTALAVAGRWQLQARGPGDGLAVGVIFGSALVAAALIGGWRPTRVDGRGRAGWRVLAPLVLLGLAAGLALVGLALLVGRDGFPSLRPAVAFAPWVGVTVLVATAEELVLRGALFDALQRLAGPLVAVVLTSAAFGLMHMPFYGWEAVPLDVGVGLVFGGLRLVTGSVVAPAVAHVAADLATWWL
jgi:membrane protease YdiL (CAAX protease family)